MVLVEDDHVVQTLSAKCADHSLVDDRVRTRRTNRRGDDIDTDAPSALAEVAPVYRVPITEQVPRLAPPGCRLDQLTPDPRGSRVGGHVDVHQLAPSLADKDQHVQRLERQGGHREQISRPQVMGVVA